MSRRRPDSPLPYSKVCDVPGDAEQLGPYAALVDAHPDALAGQHPIRRWEYAMTLRVIHAWQWATWKQAHGATEMPDPQASQICDVGGAGSNFWQVLKDCTSDPIQIVDPSLPTAGATVEKVQWNMGVEDLAASQWIAPGSIDILTCISVLEHVEETRRFLRACHTLLKPGGLLFLTMDYWDADGEDTAHYHWMRQRIYNVDRIKRLLEDLRMIGFKSFGSADWAYHGPQLFDYSVCSLALLKK